MDEGNRTPIERDEEKYASRLPTNHWDGIAGGSTDPSRFEIIARGLVLGIIGNYR
jgi:hypothetical protein